MGWDPGPVLQAETVRRADACGCEKREESAWGREPQVRGGVLQRDGGNGRGVPLDGKSEWASVRVRFQGPSASRVEIPNVRRRQVSALRGAFTAADRSTQGHRGGKFP